MGRRDYEQSLAAYERAIATARPGVTGAEIPWYGKGATLILLGRYDEALRAIDTALDINPHNDVFFQAKGGMRDLTVTGVQTCALPISGRRRPAPGGVRSSALGLPGAGLGDEGDAHSRSSMTGLWLRADQGLAGY